MQEYQLNLFDLLVSFRSPADEDRVERSRAYVDNLYHEFGKQGRHLSREKLLALLVLGIADDLLQTRQQVLEKDQKVQALLQRIDSVTKNSLS